MNGGIQSLKHNTNNAARYKVSKTQHNATFHGVTFDMAKCLILAAKYAIVDMAWLMVILGAPRPRLSLLKLELRTL